MNRYERTFRCNEKHADTSRYGLTTITLERDDHLVGSLVITGNELMTGMPLAFVEPDKHYRIVVEELP